MPPTLTDASVDTAAALAGADTAGPLAVFHGPDRTAVWETVRLAATMRAEENGGELFFAEPSATWTVAEVDELVVRYARRGTPTENVVAVRDLDRAAAGATDRLLLAVEEPGTRVWFAVSCGPVDGLSATVRGRASDEVPVVGPSEVAAVAALVDAGVPIAAAERIVSTVGAERAAVVVAAQQIAAEPDQVVTALAELTAGPVAAALRALDALTGAGIDARAAVEVAVSERRRAALDEVRGGGDSSNAVTLLHRCDLAESLARRGAPSTSVLAALAADPD